MTPAQPSDSTVINSSNSTADSDDDMMKVHSQSNVTLVKRCLDKCEALYQNRSVAVKLITYQELTSVCNLNELLNCLLEVTDQFAVMKNTLCECGFKSSLDWDFFLHRSRLSDSEHSDYLLYRPSLFHRQHAV